MDYHFYKKRLGNGKDQFMVIRGAPTNPELVDTGLMQGKYPVYCHADDLEYFLELAKKDS